MASTASAERLALRSYSTADGLARDTVHCILRDHDGFLWFGTGEGISRFNGSTFTSYRAADGLPDRDVRSLIQSRDHTFWLATGGGVVHFNPDAATLSGRFVRHILPGGNRGQSVGALLETRAGALFAGTDKGLVILHAESAAVRIQNVNLSPNGTAEPKIIALAADPLDRIWIGTSHGLFVRDTQGRLRNFSTQQGLPGEFISCFQIDGPDVWVGTHAGLSRVRLDPTGAHLLVQATYTQSSGLTNNFVQSVLRARDGSIWVGTLTNLAQLHPDSPNPVFHSFGISSGLVNGDTQALAEDTDGNLWVGKDGGGAARIVQDGLVTYDEADGFPPQSTASLTLDHSGRLLVVTSARPGLSVFRFDAGRFNRLRLPLSPDLYPETWTPWHQVLTACAGDRWWTASNHGLLELRAPGASTQDASLIRAYRISDGLPADDVAHVFQDSHGNIWFSTLPIVAYPLPGQRTGLAVWEKSTGRVRRFSEADGLPPLDSFAVLSIYEDRTGQIWVGLYRSDVARFRQGRFEILATRDGVPEGGIRVFHQDRAGRLWLGSGRGGLGRIDKPGDAHPRITSFTAANGLSSDEIQAVTEDNFGRIYAGTGFGVDRVDLDTQRVRHFSVADGLAPGEVEDAIRDPAGNLWFGTLTGISRLVPRRDEPANAMPMRIASVRVAGVLQDIPSGDKSPVLPAIAPGHGTVEIDYFALSMTGAENIAYQYRLDGAGGAWSAPTRQRSVVYGDLRAGSYRFLVRSLGPEILPSEPASVTFQILPHFWERWWFIAIVCVSLGTMLYAAYSYHLSHALAIERMRTRIARDLHDDIGSGLSKLVIMSEVAQSPRSQISAAESFRRIAGTSREVLDAVGDLVWVTNPTTEHLEDLLRRMRSFATQLFEAKGVDFHFNFAGVPPQRSLSPEVIRQLYLIFKEAVNNAARHSQCTEASVEITFANGQLTIRVIDNGIGYTPTSEPDHHGVESLKARARSLHGTIDWRPNPATSAGTIVELSVPLPK